MNHHHLLEATIKARKRHLQGALLSTLLLIINEPVTVGEIAKRIGISSAAMTGFADRLQFLGYARRASVSGDRRKWALQISTKGIAAIEAILNEK